MEPALKQRLLGAAVLIVAAIIFLPMFFSGAPPKPRNENISLEIPAAPNRDLQSRTYQVNPPASPAVQAASDAEGHVATLNIPDAAPPPVQPTTAPVTPPPHRSEPTPAPPKTASAPPKAVSAPPKASPPGHAAVQRFAVSVGVFADQGSVKARSAQAKKLGFPVYTEQLSVDGKPATGVRVGPFPDRTAAEAARLKLKSAMHAAHPSLLAYAENRSVEVPAKALAKDQAGGWAVQLAAFSDRADADKLRARARALGFDAYTDDVQSASGTLWRVRVGPRADRAEAEKLSARLKARMSMAGIVVTTP